MTDRRTAGFTLLETLVALVLLAAVMGTVFSLISTVLQGSRRDEERLRLAWIAENLLVRSGLDLVPPRNGQTPDGIRWRIEREHYARLDTVAPRGGGSADDASTPAAARPGEVALADDTRSGGARRGMGQTTGGTDASGSQTTDQAGGPEAADRPPAAVELWDIRITVQSASETYTVQTLRAEAVRERQ